MRKLSSKFVTKYISEQGTAKQGKDYFGYVELDNYACWVVAESYDHDNDVVSAQIAVETILGLFTKKPTMSKARLKNYMHQTDRQLKAQSSKFQLKASLMIVVTDYKNMRYLSCGNCKLHIFRGNTLHLKSKVHSYYQQQIDAKQIVDNDEDGMEESRNLYSYLGKDGLLKIEASKKYTLMEEDVLLLTTWGTWNKVTSVEMLDALENSKIPYDFLADVQELLLSKQQKDVNNYTMSGVFVNKVYVDDKKYEMIKKILIVVAVILLLVLVVFAISKYIANNKRKASLKIITTAEQKADKFTDQQSYDKALTEYTKAATEAVKLKKVTAKKERENEEIRNRLSYKSDTVEYLIDANEDFEQQDYKDAKLNYQAILDTLAANDYLDKLIDENDMNKKIAQCDQLIEIANTVLSGDVYLAMEDYEQALKYYKQANLLAIADSATSVQPAIKLKIDEVNKLMEDEQKQQQEKADEEEQKKLDEITKQAELFIAQGDLAKETKDYETAITDYDSAMSLYNDSAMTKEATEVSKKIAEVNTLIQQQQIDEKTNQALLYEQAADAKMDENALEEAKQNYLQAKKIYIELGLSEEIIKINDKISLVTAAYKQQEMDKKAQEIALIESEADHLLSLGRYVQAQQKYRQVQAMYQGIGATDKVLLLEEKIKTVNELVVSE